MTKGKTCLKLTIPLQRRIPTGEIIAQSQKWRQQNNVCVYCSSGFTIDFKHQLNKKDATTIANNMAFV